MTKNESIIENIIDIANDAMGLRDGASYSETAKLVDLAWEAYTLNLTTEQLKDREAHAKRLWSQLSSRLRGK